MHTHNTENIKKYTGKPQTEDDTSQYNLTKEEVAESVINSLNDAQKFLRGELKLSPINELLDELKEYVEEQKNTHLTQSPLF